MLSAAEDILSEQEHLNITNTEKGCEVNLLLSVLREIHGKYAGSSAKGNTSILIISPLLSALKLSINKAALYLPNAASTVAVNSRTEVIRYEGQNVPLLTMQSGAKN